MRPVMKREALKLFVSLMDVTEARHLTRVYRHILLEASTSRQSASCDLAGGAKCIKTKSEIATQARS